MNNRCAAGGTTPGRGLEAQSCLSAAFSFKTCAVWVAQVQGDGKGLGRAQDGEGI